LYIVAVNVHTLLLRAADIWSIHPFSSQSNAEHCSLAAGGLLVEKCAKLSLHHSPQHAALLGHNMAARADEQARMHALSAVYSLIVPARHEVVCRAQCTVVHVCHGNSFQL
jgi:hypothetical protein